jgi:hypothetical protein
MTDRLTGIKQEVVALVVDGIGRWQCSVITRWRRGSPSSERLTRAPRYRLAPLSARVRSLVARAAAVQCVASDMELLMREMLHPLRACEVP